MATDLKAKARHGVNKLFANFTPGLEEVRLVNENGEYDPATQSVTDDNAELSLLGIRTRFSDRRVDGVNIKFNDVRVLLKGDEVGEFPVDDETQAEIAGELYDVIRANKKMFGLIVEIHARRT